MYTQNRNMEVPLPPLHLSSKLTHHGVISTNLFLTTTSWFSNVLTRALNPEHDLCFLDSLKPRRSLTANATGPVCFLLFEEELTLLKTHLRFFKFSNKPLSLFLFLLPKSNHPHLQAHEVLPRRRRRRRSGSWRAASQQPSGQPSHGQVAGNGLRLKSKTSVD